MTSRERAAYAGKLAVVTGAGGFIGSHLVEALARSGARVRALVRYSSTSSRGHLERLPADLVSAVEIVSGDVTDPACVRRIVAGADVVFHLAALIGIPYSYVAPQHYVATNVAGTLHVLEAVRDLGVARLVHTSTSEVYGTARSTPIQEEHPLQAQSPYSATKIGADKLAESYHLSFGVPVVTLRPFNTYGPRQSSRAVIPSIMKQLAAGRTEIKIGSAAPKRDLNFVDDTVAAFLLAGATDAAVGRTIHAGSGRTQSIGELAATIFRVAGRADARAVADEARVRPDASEVMILLADNARATQILGYEPRVSLEDGLRRTWEYVLANAADYRPDEYSV